jgi:Na+/H+-dicarboxylate symporter
MKSSTRWILAGLALGAFAGLFLGERAAGLRIVADGYVRLLQMTVLPYVTVSLIAGIGGLNGETAVRLFSRVGALTLVLWACALGGVFLMPLMFPTIESASFFSTTLVEEQPPLDFVSLYIPSNPFHSLANNVVPAVVLFSAFVGVALIGIPGKERLIDVLSIMERALARANRYAVRLTPIGLFAIAAHTVGVADVEQLGRLQVFFVSYGAMSLLLAFWILPGLAACLTAIPVVQILRRTKDALITGFMTGDLFIVLPVVIDRSKELLAEYGVPEPAEGAPADVIVPAFYSFPHSAKLLSLSFVLFAAWYSETILTLGDYPRLALAGIVSLFGSTTSALPFLLDLVQVPADTFQLFLATGILNARFGTLTSTMHMVVLALVGTLALTGGLRISAARIVRYLVVSGVAVAATAAGVTAVLRTTEVSAYKGDEVASGMQLLRTPAREALVTRDLPAIVEASASSAGPVLADVRQRKRLRVGYFDDNAPYSFVNARGALVGFDVEMAYALAQELGVELEFVELARERLEALLAAGYCDVAMSGVVVTTDRADRLAFSPSYLDETLAFIVADHRRAAFSSAETVRGASGLRVAVPDLPYVRELAEREFPNLELVPVRELLPFLEGRLPGVDAMIATAERGSFLTLLHPAYSVAVPRPLLIKVPLAYPAARRDADMARFLGTWIELKRKDGTIEALYDHWILGRTARAPRPRWSILRNVLRVN